MKKILFVATGGTIASKKTENGLTPQITPEELISYIPEVEKICEITAVQPFNLDSSNVVPENWSMLVKVIREHYDAFDGFRIRRSPLSSPVHSVRLIWILPMPKQIFRTAFTMPVTMLPRGYRSCLTER